MHRVICQCLKKILSCSFQHIIPSKFHFCPSNDLIFFTKFFFLQGDKVETIKGHTTAVTSIDWKILSGGDCILASCADDRTVRIHNGRTYELLNILQTDKIHGWYTLTYLSINTSKDWLLCSTQNGYLILWDLATKHCMFCNKLHCGSIEGLEWNDSFQNFASIGSDCIANIFSICS